ncbi:hypothetical protein D3C87_1851500 [compost metagenome]
MFCPGDPFLAANLFLYFIDIAFLVLKYADELFLHLLQISGKGLIRSHLKPDGYRTNKHTDAVL